MVKKKFGISPAVDKALTQTIQMAKAENSHFFNTEILVDRISLDPENPRKHKIMIQDVRNGLSATDPHYKEKESELEGLRELSQSIKREGLLHPIVVVEENGNFKLVAGERRFFATILAEKKVIEARIFRKKPKPLDLKVIQWSENQSRKDLSVYEKLMNVEAILEAYRTEQKEELTAIKLSDVISVSRQQAQFYKAILSNKALMTFIQNKKITTLEVARQLSSCNTFEIDAFLNQKRESIVRKTSGAAQPGKRSAAVDLGTTQKPFVAKMITETMLATKQFGKHTDNFKPVDWTCPRETARAFRKLIALMEAELEGIA